MKEELDPIEMLRVRVLQQAGYHRLDALVESVLEIVEPDHQLGRQRCAPLVSIQPAELLIEHRPVELVGKNEQRVFTIQNLIMSGPEQVLLV